MKYTTIVLDLDGTLLGSNRCVSPQNLQTLEECTNAGLDIWIATARASRVVFGETGPLHNIDFIKNRGVFHNGAYAVDKSNGYLRHYPLLSNTVSNILDTVESMQPRLPVAIQSMEDHSFRFKDPEILEFWGCTWDECIDYTVARRIPCSKLAMWDRSKDLTKLYETLQERYGDVTNILLSDNNHWIQIMSSTATKEKALLDIFKEKGVNHESVVAIGDDRNDLGMIQMFGCGVAMGNAVTEVKKVATHITLSNDENGVSYALRDILELV